MKIKIILFIYVLTWCSLGVYAQDVIKEKKRILIIDPGHGGLDSGTVSNDGIKEKDIVLDIARSIIAWNRDLLDSKYDIYLTRSKDTLISLNDRTKLAKHLKPDVFISLHCNQIHDSTIQGVEIYIYDTNELSILFAESVLNKFHQKLGLKIREPKQANFQVLRETRENCPSLLLELGYLSNDTEAKYLKNEKNRKSLALAILMAI